MRIVAALAAVVGVSTAACVSPTPTPESHSSPPVVPAESAERSPAAGKKEFVPGIVPSDLRERGPATLKLRFRPSDGEPNRFISGRLWRLSVPASHGWTAGDEVVMPSKEELPAYVFHELPFGAYRFEVRKKRRGGVDPAAFTIESVTNEVTLTVDEGWTIPVHLAVYASDGLLYDTCSVLSNGGWGHSFGERRTYPEWTTPRVPEDPSWVERSERIGSTSGDAFPDKTPHDCHAEPDGRFRIGEVTEYRAGDVSMRSWTVSAGPGTNVVVTLQYSAVPSTDFVGVAPHPSEIRQCVVDEESRNIVGAEDAQLELRSKAVLRRDDSRQWESIPVRVKVVREGYETLEFDWTVATRDVTRRMRRLQR